MKFTLDTDNKVIYFKESFTKEDIEYLFSIIKIDNIKKWKIDMEYNVPIQYPNTIIWPPQIYPNTGTPYIVSSTSGTYDISCGTSNYFTPTNTMSFSLSEN